MTATTRARLILAGTIALAGCASVDFDYPKAESQALAATADTRLGKALAGVAGRHPGKAGFYMFENGIEALAIRLALGEKAERSIDAQYYLVKADDVGYVFIRSLVRAADRGVRVRLLVDDMFTSGQDASIAALDSHPNIEIRIFNPFARRSARVLDGITSFSRINRRMHNKSFTVDGQVTVIGGRNIAGEYFGAHKDAKFGDLDVAGIGPVVADVSRTFDDYWNHEQAAPVPAFASIPDDPAAELERVRQLLEQRFVAISNSPYAEAVLDQALKILAADTSAFVWAPYRVVVDSPDKAFKSKARDVASITTPLFESLAQAREEVLILSPYFVPRDFGVDGLTRIHDRGVDVTVITNSLSANNQSTVHGGYTPSRKPLLENGIKLYEVRADAEIAGAQIVAASGAKATLHTKAFVVDRRSLFIGSFNFDPRSANINTEVGVIIESPELATIVVERVNGALASDAYEVFLDDRGQIRWRGYRDGQEVIFDKEPETSWGLRTLAGLFRILPFKSQL